MHAFATLFAIAPLAAYAFPQGAFGPDYKTRYCPVVDSTKDITGDPWQLGVSGKGGSTITITEGHEVGTTWTIGGDLGLGVDKVLGIDATLSASVSQTITDNTAEGVEYTCPDGKWTCSIMVYPGMKLVKGHLKKIEGNNEGCGVSPTDYGGDYEFKIPRKSEKGNEQSSVQLCVCGNLEGADDKGHPELKCAEDCVNPKGK